MGRPSRSVPRGVAGGSSRVSVRRRSGMDDAGHKSIVDSGISNAVVNASTFAMASAAQADSEKHVLDSTCECLRIKRHVQKATDHSFTWPCFETSKHVIGESRCTEIRTTFI